MPKFKVTVLDRVSHFKSKIFEAADINEATYLTENDTWTPEDGWIEAGEAPFTERAILGVEEVD